MARTDDPFYPAKLITRLICDEIDQFELRCKEFIDGRKYERFSDEDEKTGEVVHKVRLLADIPDDIERDAMRFVSELRSALDKAVHAASKMIGSTDLKHAHFPFGESESHFSAQLGSLRGPWRGIPGALHAYLIALRPYWGGCDLLRAFGEISNPMKHESVLSVSLHLNRIAAYGAVNFSRMGPAWNEAKTECELFRTTKNNPLRAQTRISMLISFNDTKHLGGKEFAPTIRQVMDIVERIVVGLEAETTRVVAARG